MAQSDDRTGRVREVRFSGTSYRPSLLSGDGTVEIAIATACKVDNVVREKNFFTSRTTIVWEIPQVRRELILGLEEGELKRLLGDVYEKIADDPAFHGVRSAVPYCWAEATQSVGDGLIYLPDDDVGTASGAVTSQPAIIFLHGFGGNLLWNIWALKTEFPDRVILAPSGGICWPDNDSERIVEYLDDMRAYVEQEFGVKIERPWLIACSQGGPAGFTVANLASDRFRGFVSIASVAELPTELRYPPGFPILMINALDDQRVTIRDAEASFEALKAEGANIELEWIEDADHFLLLTRPEEVARLVREFFDKHAEESNRAAGPTDTQQTTIPDTRDNPLHVHGPDSISLGGRQGFRYWVYQYYEFTADKKQDDMLSGFPVAVFLPEGRPAKETPVVVGLQGIAAPYQWNDFLIPTLLDMGIACVLFDQPFAGERSLVRNFRGDIASEIAPLCAQGGDIDALLERILQATFEATVRDFSIVRELIRERHQLLDSRLALFGVSWGALVCSLAFCRDGLGSRLLGAIGHSDLSAFAQSFCRGPLGTVKLMQKLAGTLIGKGAGRVVGVFSSVVAAWEPLLAVFKKVGEKRLPWTRALNPLSYADRVSGDRPVRFLLGEEDTLVCPDDGRRCAAAFANGECYVVPGLGHGTTVSGPSFVDHVRYFLGTQLADWRTESQVQATGSTGVWWATAADFVGKYMWRTKGRTIEFDFHDDGTFEAEEKPNWVALSEGMGLVSKSKGVWMVVNGRLSVARTNVWMFMYWQKAPVTWINDVKVVSVTEDGIRLESGNPLQRI